MDHLQFFPVTPASVEGKGWTETEFSFSRVPVRPEIPEKVRSNAVSSTGMSVFFETDSTMVGARWELALEQLGEANFNVCAFSGVDLYGFDDATGVWRWMAAPGHAAIADRRPETVLVRDLPRRMRRFRLYLPLRNRLESLAIGVEAGARFRLIPPRPQKPLVYYGTSIIHGAFASRAGLGIAQMLGRGLDMPTVNLGFSGAALMEPEIAGLLAELDAAAFVLDPFANMNPDLVRQNCEQFLEILCGQHFNVPVVLVGDPPFGDTWYHPEKQAEYREKWALQRSISKRLGARFPYFRYLPGKTLYGGDNEIFVDGIHPNDAGMFRQTGKLLRFLRSAFPEFR